MKYLSVKRLEKYHPGYKDRTLQWAKIYFKMVQGDPDCELIENETDWGRLIKFILLQLQAQKPIPLTATYLSKKGFDLKKRPISLTLKVLHNFVSVREEVLLKRYVDKDKDKDKEEDKEQSQADAVLKKIYSGGFNIYRLLNNLKKKIGFPTNFNFPEEVIIKVCNQYFKDKAKIIKPWPWFIRVFAKESEKYHAEKNIKINKDSKMITINNDLKVMIQALARKHGVSDK